MKELMELVKDLSFVRVGGSSQEEKAAELVLGEVNRAAQEAGREDIRGAYETFRGGRFPARLFCARAA